MRIINFLKSNFMPEYQNTPATTDEVVSTDSAPAADVQPSDVPDTPIEGEPSTVPTELVTTPITDSEINIMQSLGDEIVETPSTPVVVESEVPLVTQINPAEVAVDTTDLPEDVKVINGRKYQETVGEDGCTYLNLLS